MLEQMKGSIMNYFYAKWNVTVLSDKSSTEVVIPSMFFPTPRVIPSSFTKDSFENTYLMNVKLFHQTSNEALAKAEEIAQSIRATKFTIPLINSDGTTDEGFIVFDDVDSEVIEDGVAQIALRWAQIYNYI